ncbi:ABC transporter permease [Actinoplanes sp. NPDC051470]|uniref:ABC transporter permease n=1 Tax=unclassified Actinoplanes TaxID=2626549 RepID=UPI0034214A08
MAYDEQVSDPAAYRTGYAAQDFRSRHGLDPDQDGGSGQPLRLVPSEDSGRDRLGIHIGWEIILLLTVAAVGFLLYRLEPDALRRPALDTLLIWGSAIGLLALGAGLTLRAGVPNLAIGPIAVAASLHYAENGDKGLLRAAVPALIIAAIAGLVVAILVISLHVPGWAATLAAALGVVVYNQLRTAPVNVQGTFDPSDQAFFLFGGFALLAVLGGATGTVAPIRRFFGKMRPLGDPARRRGAGVTVPVVAALVFSSLFAVVSGILLATVQPNTPVTPGPGFEWTGIAIGTAMLAGTSAYGRRGGIFGTLLATAALTLFLDYADRRDFDIALYAIAAAVVAAGLVVTRLIETYGRPQPLGGTDDDWQMTAASSAGTWHPDQPETWSPSPAQPQQRTDRWDDGPWGGARQ